ncbi:FecR family protein [Deminuibacter soli]|uniref:FecR protein domain-containing protein n=1 Tax=Deminuibacter soli TaxID=2291815 RepID=A0A3E1NGX2_9BACT|nr:FecR domain-containing protein [Deminuibacter soli]RFM27048.1 hypothetical protein DXN05_16390 [Deminuibacter soli]
MIWKRRKSGTFTDEQWQQAWQQPAHLSSERKQELLGAIHNRIHTASANGRRRVLYISAGAVAAVLTALIVKFTWMNNSQVPVSAWDVVASDGNKKKVELADGSVIWLAPNSAIHMYPTFAAKRSVVLDKGTAFFSVTKDQVHPFSIAVNKQKVLVLGTQFTITVKDTTDLHLAVKEGTVALHNQRGQVIVHGGQQVSTVNNNTGNTNLVPAIAADWWLQQEVRLFDVPLGELIDNVSAYYHVKLNTTGVNRLTKVTLTWNFSQPLRDNLAVLNQLTGNTIH